MQVIPVIDIKDGVAVHARAGRLAEYQPLQTPYARSAAPLAVVAGLSAALPVSALYIADLDATSVEAANTAVAARSIADDRTAALASPGAADLYGLQPLALDCQDADDNVTTFAVLARR